MCVCVYLNNYIYIYIYIYSVCVCVCVCVFKQHVILWDYFIKDDWQGFGVDFLLDLSCSPEKSHKGGWRLFDNWPKYLMVRREYKNFRLSSVIVVDICTTTP